MACTPPFARGTGGWCTCNCKCCKPPCWNTVTLTFQCGTTEDNYAGTPNEGCPCSWLGFRARNAPKPVNLPEFNYDPITSADGKFVFALSGTCSVPCTTVTVTVTTDACCLEVADGVIYAVGTGNVTATADPTGTIGGSIVFVTAGARNPGTVTTGAANTLATGDSVTIAGCVNQPECNGTWTITVIDSTHFSLDGSPGGGDGAESAATWTSTTSTCGEFIPTVNGSPDWATVADGDIVTIDMETSDPDCCPCCQVHSPVGSSPVSMMGRRATTKIRGVRAKTRQSKPISEPPEAFQ